MAAGPSPWGEHSQVSSRSDNPPSSSEQRSIREGLWALAEALVDLYITSRSQPAQARPDTREDLMDRGGGGSRIFRRSEGSRRGPPSLLEALDERAGIMEYDGHVSRDEAERLAIEELSIKVAS